MLKRSKALLGVLYSFLTSLIGSFFWIGTASYDTGEWI